MGYVIDSKNGRGSHLWIVDPQVPTERTGDNFRSPVSGVVNVRHNEATCDNIHRFDEFSSNGITSWAFETLVCLLQFRSTLNVLPWVNSSLPPPTLALNHSRARNSDIRKQLLK